MASVICTWSAGRIAVVVRRRGEIIGEPDDPGRPEQRHPAALEDRSCACIGIMRAIVRAGALRLVACSSWIDLAVRKRSRMRVLK